jgi:hypothetical protein
MVRQPRRLVVVLAVAGAGLVPAPATAAGYCSGSGVNVVVDFGALGGGIQKGCDGSGNRSAAQAFENTGHHLSYAQRQPGFVCRVDGAPASDPCVSTSPADAYWGLYWSDGTSGWKYASVAAGSLTVPAGATVAFSWQNGGDADPPGTAPAAPAPAATATPTRQPTAKATTKVTAKAAPKPATAPTRPAAPTPSPTASTSTTGPASASPDATASPSSAASVPATPATTTSAAVAAPEKIVHSDSAQTSERGLPWWLPAGLVLALGTASGVVWRVRRSRP